MAPFTRWAFYAWMASLPFDIFTLPWLPLEFQDRLSIPRMAGVVLTLCFLIDPKTRPWRLPPASLALAAFFAIFTLSMLRSDFTDVTMVLQQFQSIVLLLICYNLFLAGKATKGALFSFVLTCGAAAIMVLAGVAESEIELGGRLSTFGSNQNEYSQLLAVGVLVAIGVGHIRQEKASIRVPILWAIALVAMAVIAQAGSRGQTLALAVGLGLFILRKGSLWVKLRNLGLMVLLAGVAFYFYTHVEVLRERWQEALEYGTTAGRERIWPEAVAMIAEKPIIGWGPSATRVLAQRLFYRWGPERATHNNVLAMLTFTGLAGAVPYFWAYFMILWYAWRARCGVENVLPLAIFVALFIGDSVSGGLPGKLHWTFFAYMLAAGALAQSAARSPKLAATAPPGVRTVQRSAPC